MDLHPQPLVASFKKSGNDFHITLRDHSDGPTRALIRVFEPCDRISAPRHTVIGRDYLRAMVEELVRTDPEAEAAA